MRGPLAGTVGICISALTQMLSLRGRAKSLLSGANY